jgi:nitroreductase
MTQTMVDTEVIAGAVELACRAPSLHNSQPWRWVIRGTVVDLFADPHRIVASTDNSGRQATISCGAVLDHFQVAMAAVGWAAEVDRFPNPNNLDHLASIDFAPMDYVSQARRDRADAIRHRRTDRRAFREPTDWAAFEPMLRSSYDTEWAELAVLADDARPRLAEASRLTESLRRYDDPYHRELDWWTAPLRGPDGIPASALVAQGPEVEVNRHFPSAGDSQDDAKDSGAPHDQAKILVLSTREDTRADALDCGQALSAVLLECTMAGLATCTVTHLTELEAGRNIVRELLSGATSVPQALIRVGIDPAGDVGEPTPRRPVREILEIRG